MFQRSKTAIICLLALVFIITACTPKHRPGRGLFNPTNNPNVFCLSVPTTLPLQLLMTRLQGWKLFFPIRTSKWILSSSIQNDSHRMKFLTILKNTFLSSWNSLNPTTPLSQPMTMLLYSPSITRMTCLNPFRLSFWGQPARSGSGTKSEPTNDRGHREHCLY